MRNRNYLFVFFLMISILFTSCLGWGDIFQSNKKLDGNYYLKEGDIDYKIYFKDGDDYIGAIPTPVTQYCVLPGKYIIGLSPDSLYRIIDLKKEFSQDKGWDIGPFTSTQLKTWSSNKQLPVKFIPVN